MAEYVVGQCSDFIGGQDSSLVPGRIPDNCISAGVNVSTKRASLSPRWGFEKQEVIYPEGGYYNRARKYVSYKSLFETGKFQAAVAYPVDSVARLLIIISGVIFLYNINTHTLTLVPISDGSMLNPRASRINTTPAGKSLVVFDFPNYPVIITGSTARRSDQSKYEVPVATNGAYNQSRLFIANSGNEFTGGDPVGNELVPDAPLTFEEISAPAAAYLGQIFQLPTQTANEPIAAMGFLQSSDISTGIGPLWIATNRAIYTYNTTNPRSAWTEGQFGSLLTYNVGMAGPRAWTNANSDMFFMGNDGYVRSLSMSRDEQARWARVPISREVEPWLKYSDPALKKFSFVTYFKNKVFFSANPFRAQAVDYASGRPIFDYAHAGMVVLELDNVTSFGSPSKPSWAGLWTGVNPMEMLTLNERAFIISKDNGVNSIWEMNPEIHYDTSDCKMRYVRSRVYTKEHSCGDSFMNKEIHSLDLNLDAIKGDFKLDVKYRSSHSPKFLPWGTVQLNAPWRDCKVPCNGCLEGYAHHMVRDLTIGSPSGDSLDCDPSTMELYQVFRAIQLQFTITGMYWELHEYRVKAQPRVSENQETACHEFQTVAICQDCNDDWSVGGFDICPAQQKVT